MERHINDIKPSAVSVIWFGNSSPGGTEHCQSLHKWLSVRFEMRSRSSKILIKHEDIDNLIEALKYAKEHWGE